MLGHSLSPETPSTRGAMGSASCPHAGKAGELWGVGTEDKGASEAKHWGTEVHGLCLQVLRGWPQALSGGRNPGLNGVPRSVAELPAWDRGLGGMLTRVSGV